MTLRPEVGGQAVAAPRSDRGPGPRINDVVVTVATSNGSGSWSANLILMRTMFNMGVPVSGKNMFPSNIQGLPTWFTIRANKDGWTARRADSDIFVAMNPESIVDDLAHLRPGSILILNEDLKGFLNRDDLVTFIIPFAKLVVPICPDARLRRFVVNMMYVGAVAWILGLDLEEMRRAVDWQFKSKPKAADINHKAALAAYQWAAENLQNPGDYKMQKMDATRGHIIIEGNTAGAIGFLFGGVTVVGWYPITPSTGMAESLGEYLDKYRRDEIGKATYAIVQMEDELGSMAVVVGAGWAGARAMTTTSGPGISLMSELAGLAYFTECPAVICDVQRMGPSTGLPTRTSQGDMSKAYYLSHGDCKHVLLIPGTIEEIYEMAAETFNLAERLQTLVFLMIDLDFGMNSWMSPPFKPITKPMDRGKVLHASDIEKLEEFARYRDVDGDGIPYRTLPGTHHPNAAFFTRGTGHTDRATYSEKPWEWTANLDRLARKFETARKMVPRPVIETEPDSRICIMAYGSSHLAVQEARHLMREERGWASNYLRLRALPPGEEVREFLRDHDCIYLVEQNRDGQVAAILRDEYPEFATRIRSVLHYDGLPIDARSIVDLVQKLEEQKQ